MTRIPTLLVTGALLLTACTGGSSSTDQSTTALDPTTTSRPTVEFENATTAATPLPQVATLFTEYELVIYREDHRLTEDRYETPDDPDRDFEEDATMRGLPTGWQIVDLSAIHASIQHCEVRRRHLVVVYGR